MAGSMGYATQLGIEDASPVTKGFEFDDCTLTRESVIVDSSGLRGSRYHRKERTRAGNYTCQGQITMQPSPEDLALLLPWILGANASGTTFALAQTLQSRNVVVDKVAKVATYAGVKVNRATFSGSAGTPLRLVLDVVGTTETIGAAASFPSVTYTNTAPFMFAESVLTMVSSARTCMDWSVTIDNALSVRFSNSQTATDISATDLTVALSTTVPYDSTNADLYDQALAGSACTLVMAPSNYSLTFTFATLQVPAVGPTINGRGEEVLTINGIARMSTTTNPLVITLDSTP